VLIGFVGRFSEEKNIDLTIDIFNEILKEGVKAKLVLVGRGHTKNQLVNKIRTLSLEDKIIFTGVRNDIQDLMCAFDILLLPSFYEGMPVVLIEAQASGLKCYTTDVVSKESEISDLIYYYSLNHTAKEWARKIIENGLYYDRKNMYKEVEENGYDIQKSSRSIQLLYKELNKTRWYSKGRRDYGEN